MNIDKTKEELLTIFSEHLKNKSIEEYMRWFLKCYGKNIYSKGIGRGAKEIFLVERKELADRIRLYRKLNRECPVNDEEQGVIKI